MKILVTEYKSHWRQSCGGPKHSCWQMKVCIWPLYKPWDAAFLLAKGGECWLFSNSKPEQIEQSHAILTWYRSPIDSIVKPKQFLQEIRCINQNWFLWEEGGKEGGRERDREREIEKGGSERKEGEREGEMRERERERERDRERDREREKEREIEKECVCAFN